MLSFCTLQVSPLAISPYMNAANFDSSCNLPKISVFCRRFVYSIILYAQFVIIAKESDALLICVTNIN